MLRKNAAKKTSRHFLYFSFSVKKFLITVTDTLYIVTKFYLSALMQPKYLAAHRTNLFQRMGHQYGGGASAHYLLHFGFALFSESTVAYRQHLIKDKYVRFSRRFIPDIRLYNTITKIFKQSFVVLSLCNIKAYAERIRFYCHRVILTTSESEPATII